MTDILIGLGMLVLVLIGAAVGIWQYRSLKNNAEEPNQPPAPASSSTHVQPSAAPAKPKLQIPIKTRLRAPLDSRHVEFKNLLAEVNDGLKKVPPVPQIVHQLMIELSRDNSSSATVARLVAQEPVLAATLLRVVNSAAYGLVRNVVSVEEAVTYLGAGAVRALVIRMELGKALGEQTSTGYDSKRLWQHSVVVSQVAEALARRVKRVDVAFASTLGLLHDIGKLTANGTFPLQVQQVLDDTRWPAGESFLAREATMFGQDHAGLGSAMARQWALPPELITGIELHHSFADEKRMNAVDARLRRAVLVVAVANQLAKYAYVYCDNMEIDIIPPWVMQELGLPEELENAMDQEITGTISRSRTLSLNDEQAEEQELERQVGL